MLGFERLSTSLWLHRRGVKRRALEPGNQRQMKNMRMGNYKICQGCLGPIFRNGVYVQKRKGRGYEKEGKYFHFGCFKKWQKKYLTI
jgi:hypothetical protein